MSRSNFSSSSMTAPSHIASTLAAMGLFLTTAVVSQFIQNQHRSKRNANEEDDREQERSSSTRRSNRSTRNGNSRTKTNDRYPDFHPKYQNWRHFEDRNERDRADDEVESHKDSIGSGGNQYASTTSGQHAFKYHEKSSSSKSESDSHLVSDCTNGPESASSKLQAQHKIKPTDDQNQVGKFERFYRMLSNSIIVDDKSQQQDCEEPPIRIFSSSNKDSDDLTTLEDVEDRYQARRIEYNAQIMPEKLILIRHGQSLGNIDETVYATTSDNAMPITDLGWEQAQNAGRILKDKILNPDEAVHFIVSPYVRTVETFHGIVSAWCDPDSPEFASIEDHNRRVNAWYERLTELGLTWNEDPRIREQDFGNYQNPESIRRAKEERHRFGTFYYRFNNGESGSDVFDRVSTFLNSLWRSFETNRSQNYVLVTHGIVLRVLMARYFRYTISQLNMLANPLNCEMVVLGHDGDGRLDLEGRFALEVEKDQKLHQYTQVKGYQFHRQLRILPKSLIRTVHFRISPKDKNKMEETN